MAKRAEQVQETRRRIVEATVTMHETVGPAATTIAGIAETAGVTRLTVYRHFPDDEALYAACSAHWLAGRVLPDPESWKAHAHPEERLRAGLSDLYRYYRGGHAMLTRIYGDIASLPEGLRAQLADAERTYVKVLVLAFSSPQKRPRLRAVVGHAVSFWTWRSLCLEQRLSDRDAVDLMAKLAVAALDAGHRRRQEPAAQRRAGR